MCEGCGQSVSLVSCVACGGRQCKCMAVPTTRGWLCCWCCAIVTAWISASNGRALVEMHQAGLIADVPLGRLVAEQNNRS
jgi:hypothetical protein